ncbi:MAG: DUF5684 domain-containing protein [Elusimicrobiota bacterium]
MESQGPNAIVLLIQLAIVVVSIAALWKVFVKAGKPGWAAIIPFYNLYVLLVIAGKPGWWLILLFVPLVNLVFAFLAMLALARAFGKGVGFAIGLYLIGFVFFPILAFGDAEYAGPALPEAPPAAA